MLYLFTDLVYYYPYKIGITNWRLTHIKVLEK